MVREGSHLQATTMTIMDVEREAFTATTKSTGTKPMCECVHLHCVSDANMQRMFSKTQKCPIQYAPVSIVSKREYFST